MHGGLATDADSPQLQRVGFPTYEKLASPAAGADFASEASGTYFQRLITVWCRLVCSATVANREVVLQFLSPTGDVFRACGAATVATASTTVDYSFSIFQPLTEFPVDSSILVPLDSLLLPQAFTWKLHVVNVDATDQISRVRVFRELFASSSPVPGRA